MHHGFTKSSTYLRIRVLRWKATRFIGCCIPSANDTNVEVIEFERTTDTHNISRVYIQMDESGITVAIDAMDIRQSVSDVSSNL